MPDEPTVVETVTWPQWGRPPIPDDEAISLHQLQLAHFYGTTGEEASPAQAHVERLEDWLRSHAVGGSTRKSEGFYGDKTADLINAAYKHYLNIDGNGIPGPDLIEALRAAGAPVTA